jgi:ferritin-like protein
LGFAPTILEIFFVEKLLLAVSRITSTYYYYMVKMGKIKCLGANIFER